MLGAPSILYVGFLYVLFSLPKLLAGADAGTGVMGSCRGVGGILLVAWAGSWGESRDAHRNTQTHAETYTQMLHLPFSDPTLETSGGLTTVFFVRSPKMGSELIFLFFFFPSRNLIVLLLPTKNLYEAELPSLFRKNRGEKGVTRPSAYPGVCPS